MASEEMSFENVDERPTDGRTTDGRRMPAYTISSSKSNFGYPKIFFGYHKIKLIIGYPKMELWISKNRFLDIHKLVINSKTASIGIW